MALKLDHEEQMAMDHLLAVMHIIHDWNLIANSDELTHAIHTIQLFIIMHALRNDSNWSTWYGA